MRGLLWFISGALITALMAQPAAAQKKESGKWSWYAVDKEKNVRLHLYFFWSRTCPRCPKAIEFVKEMEKKHEWLKVYHHEIGSAESLDLYKRMSASLKQAGGQVPAFIYCKQLVIGIEGNAKRIERGLVRCQEALQKKQQEEPAPEEPKKESRLEPRSLLLLSLIGMTDLDAATAAEPAEEADPELPIDLPPDDEETDRTVLIPLWGEVQPSQVSLPILTFVMAGCDAFNPCAFFVLLFLLSLLIHGRSRVRMLVVGGVFVFFSGLMYFLSMAAWLNVFQLWGNLRAIMVVAGCVAIVVSLLNIKDFFWFKRGLSLSIPDSAKPGLFQRMTALIKTTRFTSLVAGSAVLACLANLYELLCTSGFPLVYTGVLTARNLPLSSRYLYLGLYTLIYVTPLILIVAGFTFTLGSRKLTEFEGRVLKLLSGLMMLLLGIILLWDPKLLNTLVGAIGTLIGAVGLTAIIVILHKAWSWSQGAAETAKVKEGALSR